MLASAWIRELRDSYSVVLSQIRTNVNSGKLIALNKLSFVISRTRYDSNLSRKTDDGFPVLGELNTSEPPQWIAQPSICVVPEQLDLQQGW